jgi:hypothetical protein
MQYGDLLQELVSLASLEAAYLLSLKLYQRNAEDMEQRLLQLLVFLAL